MQLHCLLFKISNLHLNARIIVCATLLFLFSILICSEVVSDGRTFRRLQDNKEVKRSRGSEEDEKEEE